MDVRPPPLTGPDDHDLGPRRPPPPPTNAERLRALLPLLTPTQWAAGAAAMALLLGAGLYWVATRGDTGPPVETHIPLATPPPATSTTVAGEITVHAAGAVNSPGLQVVAVDARVADVVVAAGGLSEAADLDRVNLAALVVDAQRIYIPRIGEDVPQEIASTGALDAGSGAVPVDINSADRDALDTLPGIGPATADAIIGFREQVGRFNSPEGLLEVPGIGPAKLEQLRDRVSVG